MKQRDWRSATSGPQPQLPTPHGEGIGLAIVKRLRQLLEASLELESDDSGTLFRVTLPTRCST
jgi:signal transduction histidine kinase